MSENAPQPTDPLPITELDGTDVLEIKSPYLADFAMWIKEQYKNGEPVIILYPLPETKWHKFMRWMKGIWDELTGWWKGIAQNRAAERGET